MKTITQFINESSKPTITVNFCDDCNDLQQGLVAVCKKHAIKYREKENHVNITFDNVHEIPYVHEYVNNLVASAKCPECKKMWQRAQKRLDDLD